MKITPYLSDILSQPDALQKCLSELRHRPALTTARARLSSGHYRRIVLTGMGASHSAAIPLLYRLLRHGFAAHLIETSELVHHLAELIAPDSLIVAVSQSGQSAEIIDLLDLAGGRADLIAITNDEKSPLAVYSRVFIPLRAGPEYTVSCKTYLNTLAALTALGDDLTGEAAHAAAQLPALSDAPAKIEAYLAAWGDHIARLKACMASAENLFLLGRGDSLAAAHTGGLIIKEAARFPAQAMSCAAYRHGPIEITTPATHVVIFAGPLSVRQFNQNLADDIRQFGGAAYLVNAGDSVIGAEVLPVFNLPRAPLPAMPLLEILPAQMLSVALADRAGHEAGVFRFAAKVTTIQ